MTVRPRRRNARTDGCRWPERGRESAKAAVPGSGGGLRVFRDAIHELVRVHLVNGRHGWKPGIDSLRRTKPPMPNSSQRRFSRNPRADQGERPPPRQTPSLLEARRPCGGTPLGTRQGPRRPRRRSGKHQGRDRGSRPLRVWPGGRPSGWRWWWDSNPRKLALHTLSRRAPSSTRRHHRGRAYPTLRCAKNSISGAAHSSAITSAITSGRWLRRRSRTTSHSDPTAPAFGSTAP